MIFASAQIEIQHDLPYCSECALPLSPSGLSIHPAQDSSLWCPCCGEFFSEPSPRLLKAATDFNAYLDQPNTTYGQALQRWKAGRNG